MLCIGLLRAEEMRWIRKRRVRTTMRSLRGTQNRIGPKSGRTTIELIILIHILVITLVSLPFQVVLPF